MATTVTAATTAFSLLRSTTNEDVTATAISIREVIPQYLPTSAEGADLYANTLVRGIKLYTDADPTEFKRYLGEPAATNLFLNSEAPANQNIDLTSTGTGNYTLSVHGSGSVTVAAGTAAGTGFGTASAGTDVTFNITAVGTITLTVTDTPDIVQVEKGSFATSPITTGASAVARQATRLVCPSAGVLRGNDIGGMIGAIPEGAGQTAWLWYSYVDADNGCGVMLEPTQITFRKRAGGVNTDCSVAYTHAADTPIFVDWRTTASGGMGIRYTAWTGAAWSAWSAWSEVTTAAGKAAMQLATTFEYGSANGSAVFAGNIQEHLPFWTANIEAYLEAA